MHISFCYYIIFFKRTHTKSQKISASYTKSATGQAVTDSMPLYLALILCAEMKCGKFDIREQTAVSYARLVLPLTDARRTRTNCSICRIVPMSAKRAFTERSAIDVDELHFLPPFHAVLRGFLCIFSRRLLHRQFPPLPAFILPMFRSFFKTVLPDSSRKHRSIFQLPASQNLPFTYLPNLRYNYDV